MWTWCLFSCYYIVKTCSIIKKAIFLSSNQLVSWGDKEHVGVSQAHISVINQLKCPWEVGDIWGLMTKSTCFCCWIFRKYERGDFVQEWHVSVGSVVGPSTWYWNSPARTMFPLLSTITCWAILKKALISPKLISITVTSSRMQTVSECPPLHRTNT